MPERQEKYLATIVGIYNPQRAESMKQAAEELGLTGLKTAEPGEEYHLPRVRWEGDGVKSTVEEGCVFIEIPMPREDVEGFWAKVRELEPLAPSA